VRLTLIFNTISRGLQYDHWQLTIEWIRYWDTDGNAIDGLNMPIQQNVKT